MNENQISIAVDAMGGDNSPEKTIKGCEIFLNDIACCLAHSGSRDRSLQNRAKFVCICIHRNAKG